MFGPVLWLLAVELQRADPGPASHGFRRRGPYSARKSGRWAVLRVCPILVKSSVALPCQSLTDKKWQGNVICCKLE